MFSVKKFRFLFFLPFSFDASKAVVESAVQPAAAALVMAGVGTHSGKKIGYILTNWLKLWPSLYTKER